MLPNHAPFVLLVAFACLCLVATLWSPDQALAVKTFLKFIGVAVVCVTIAVSPAHIRRSAITALGVSAAVLSLMVVVFRFWPFLEAGFFFSPFATYTVDPDLLGDLLGGAERANVLADDRAGAVFTNANVASLFLGLVLFLVQAVRLGPKRTTALSLPLIAGIVATGSKAGLLALLVTGSLWIATFMRGRLSLGTVAAILAGCLLALPLLGFYIVRFQLWEVAVAAFGSRLEVWGVAIAELGQRPLLGLGFGGWERYIDEARPFEGTFIPYPLHNLILIAWSWVGILGAAVATAFVISSIAAPLRDRARGRLNRLTATALSLAFLWLFIQSMFTNAAVTDIRIGIPVGLALGLLTPASAGGGAGRKGSTEHLDPGVSI
jgi:O-antigen ligase